MITDTGELLAEYRAVQARLDRGLALLEQAGLIHELLNAGVFDLDGARAAVDELRREIAEHKRGRP
jgi:hypothetical protein